MNNLPIIQDDPRLNTVGRRLVVPTFVLKETVYEYRIHYDAKTKIAIRKTMRPADESESYITVDKETYDSIEFCGRYQVVNGKLEEAKTEKIPTKKIVRDPNGRFATLRNNLIFIVGDDYTGPIDTWRYIGDAEEIKPQRETSKKIARDPDGKFATLKNNLIFVAGENYTGLTDTWRLT